MSTLGLNLIISAKDAASAVLGRITGSLSSGRTAMEDYNAANANGNAAMEKFLAPGAVLGGGSADRTAVRDALDARRAANQLDLALRAAGQGSRAFRPALIEQRKGRVFKNTFGIMFAASCIHSSRLVQTCWENEDLRAALIARLEKTPSNNQIPITKHQASKEPLETAPAFGP